MKDRVIYEYVIELKDDFGDIVNISFYENLNILSLNIPDSKDFDYDIALVRTTGNGNEGVKNKSYAYFNNGKCPPYFSDGIAVPQRYLQEDKID